MTEQLPRLVTLTWCVCQSMPQHPLSKLNSKYLSRHSKIIFINPSVIIQMFAIRKVKVSIKHEQTIVGVRLRND